MKDFRILAGAALALCIATLAIGQSGGGFPSRPTFQRATVSAPAGGVVVITSTVGATDERLQFDVPSLDGFYIGSNNSGSTNAIGALTGTDYIYTNQNRSIVLGTQSTARLTVGGSGNIAIPITMTVAGGGTGPACSNGTAASNAVICSQSLSSANYSAMFGGSTTAGQSFGVLITAGTNSSDQALRVNSAANVSLLTVRGDGAVLVGTGTGTSQIPKIAFGTVGGVGSCSTAAQIQGISSTCSRSSTGVYVITFLASFFAVAPTCTATVVPGSFAYVGINPTSATSATITALTNANVAVDSSVGVICVGF